MPHHPQHGDVSRGRIAPRPACSLVLGSERGIYVSGGPSRNVDSGRLKRRQSGQRCGVGEKQPKDMSREAPWPCLCVRSHLRHLRGGLAPFPLASLGHVGEVPPSVQECLRGDPACWRGCALVFSDDFGAQNAQWWGRPPAMTGRHPRFGAHAEMRRLHPQRVAGHRVSGRGGGFLGTAGSCRPSCSENSRARWEGTGPAARWVGAGRGCGLPGFTDTAGEHPGFLSR